MKDITNKPGSTQRPSAGIMCQGDWWRCLDVVVRRATEYNTNHQVLCIKTRMSATIDMEKHHPLE